MFCFSQIKSGGGNPSPCSNSPSALCSLVILPGQPCFIVRFPSRPLPTFIPLSWYVVGKKLSFVTFLISHNSWSFSHCHPFQKPLQFWCTMWMDSTVESGVGNLQFFLTVRMTCMDCIARIFGGFRIVHIHKVFTTKQIKASRYKNKMSEFTDTANASTNDATPTKDLAWRLYKSRHYAEAVDAFSNAIESCGGVEADAWAGRR